MSAFYSNGVYFDTSNKSDCMGSGNNRRHAEYRAEVCVYGRRIRKRFKTYSDAQDWIAKMRSDVMCGRRRAAAQ